MLLSEGWATSFSVSDGVTVTAANPDGDALTVASFVEKVGDDVKVALATAAVSGHTLGDEVIVTFCTTRITAPTCTRVTITQDAADPWASTRLQRDENHVVYNLSLIHI